MSQREFKTGDIVTVKFDNASSSNTYIVDTDCGDTVLLCHPLFSRALIRFKKESLDVVSPNVKDSTERSLDFVKTNLHFLDYNTVADHEALCLYFVVRRKLTPRQKRTLSNICGFIASIKLNNNINQAMELVTSNVAILDEFNLMWYKNFHGLFSGRQAVTSNKQRAAVFNIAGFVMAELERPVATNGYN